MFVTIDFCFRSNLNALRLRNSIYAYLTSTLSNFLSFKQLNLSWIGSISHKPPSFKKVLPKLLPVAEAWNRLPVTYDYWNNSALISMNDPLSGTVEYMCRQLSEPIGHRPHGKLRACKHCKHVPRHRLAGVNDVTLAHFFHSASAAAKISK